MCCIIPLIILYEEPVEECVVVETEPIEIHSNKEVEELTIEEIAYKQYINKMAELETVEDKLQWFIEYNELISEYTEYLDPPETIYDVFSEDEVLLICRVVETETYQCDFESKVNVANVILNRYYDGRFGDTITEIITSPNQFTYCRENINEDTIWAVMYAYEIEDTTNGALYFHSMSYTDTFGGAEWIFTDDAGHHFYK